MKFGLITYILHHQHKDKFYSYEPYIREMNIWLKFTTGFFLLAPKKDKFPDPVEISYLKDPNEFFEIPQIDAVNGRGVTNSIISIPGILFKLYIIMSRADHIHLRCPGNIGLLGCLVQIFFPHKPKTAKYAGNWNPKAKQPWSYKLQKWILSNTFLTRNMNVLVYGQWPNQTHNILPFFTASFSESEKEMIAKKYSPPYRFLFVGGLVEGKQPLFALKLVAELNENNIPAELHVYGNGPLKSYLVKEAENKNYIHLLGNQPLEVIKKACKDAHFLVLASKSEGWPKAVAEAMFFGCIPVASGVSCVPQMLNYGSRGILIPEVRMERGNPPLRFGQGGKRKEDNQDVLKGVDSGRKSVDSGTVLDETVERIIELINDPEEMKRMSMEAQEWSQQYTLEKFEEGIKEILEVGNVSYNKSSSPFGRGGGEG